jgi:periplasmic divalent cation tolerance protein
MRDKEVRLFYVPCPSREVALDLGKHVVEKRLAACANVWAEHTSVYEWKGLMVEESETLLLLKTTQARAEALATYLEQAHPYEVPCILQLPIAELNEPYLDWLSAQIGG